MKIKIVIGLMFVLSHAAFASKEIPANYVMEHRDGSFAYNRLDVKVDGGQLKFNSSSGQELELYQNLISLPAGLTWASLPYGRATALFSVPVENCKLATSDSKIVTCRADLLTINVKGTAYWSGESESNINEKNDLNYATVEIRKVELLTDLMEGSESKFGYELVITTGSRPVLVQRYFR